VKDRDDVQVVRIDVVSWGSPVATQFEIDRLPTLLLYDGMDLVEDDTRAVLTRVARGR
jgi:hypothetical protein